MRKMRKNLWKNEKKMKSMTEIRKFFERGEKMNETKKFGNYF